jgi:BirA family biotin operon repressor/biotin-[acetyl-CoA-carboxylase] ligase
VPDILWFPTLDSTNRYLLDAAATLPSGTLVAADTQTAGRGRQGRAWVSPPGVNLYASLLLKPPELTAPPTILTQAASLAICDTVRAAGVAGAWIKWPNDVLVEQRKLAGVLTECRLTAGVPDALVIGMGVNLNMNATALAAIGQPATSVAAETGRPVERTAFCQALRDRLLANLATLAGAGPAALHARWVAASRLPGQTVIVTLPTGPVSGTVVALAADGALHLRLADGALRVCQAGEVSLRLANGAAAG